VGLNVRLTGHSGGSSGDSSIAQAGEPSLEHGTEQVLGVRREDGQTIGSCGVTPDRSDADTSALTRSRL
jgi:hypothetical protein